MNEENNGVLNMSKETAAAWAAVKQGLGPLVKDSTNPHFRSRFASLGAVMDAIAAPLADNKLDIIQTLVVPQTHAVALATWLLNTETGEVVSLGVLESPIAKSDPQGVGSSITYMRRYALQSIFGLVPEDDDGNAASAPATAPRASAPRRSRGRGRGRG